MRILYYLAYIAGNSVTVFLTWKFYSVVFTKSKVHKDIDLLCFSLYFTLTICLQQFVSDARLQLVGSLFLLALLTLLYEEHWTKKAFSAISLFLFTAFIHYGLIFLSGRGRLLLFHPDSFNSIIGITLETLFFYLFITLITFTGNYFRSNTTAMINWSMAFIVPLCAVLLLCVSLVLVRGNQTFDGLLFFSVLALAAVNLLSLCSYWFRALRIRLELVTYQNKYYKNQLETIETSETAFKSLRHDLKNHLVILSDLLQEENPAQARAYLTTICSQLDASATVSHTGNSGIDSLLNYKLRSLADSNIHLDYQAEIPSKLNIDAFDLTVILGNLLDNALEALDRLPASEEKQLSIHLKYDRGRLLITVSNTYDGAILSSRTGLLTRKKDASMHGIGLKNVRAAVGKYNGYLKIVHNPEFFIVYAVVYELADEG